MPETFDQPAFPQTAAVGPAGDLYWPAQEGLTMRDYFAGQALVGILACFKDHSDAKTVKDRVAKAFAYADAMLAERVK